LRALYRWNAKVEQGSRHTDGRSPRGVGIASESPKYDGQSIDYGKLRAAEILRALNKILAGNRDWWMGLTQANSYGNKEGFITMAIYLKNVGID